MPSNPRTAGTPHPAGTAGSPGDVTGHPTGAGADPAGGPGTPDPGPSHPVTGNPGDPDPGGADSGPSLVRSSSLIAIASLVSRVTGFLRTLAVVGVLGFTAVNDSYTLANTLPNIVYELLLGGVLTSVMIPVLVRAQRDDGDGGEVFTRRLLTLAGVALLVATGLAMLGAPLLTALLMGSGGGADGANPDLAVAFAYLLLPQILFYGIGALLGAVLNSKGVYGPFAWAPVLNNLVVLVVLAVFALMPGRLTVDPVRMGEPKLLVLGLGTTLGIVAQAAVLVPAMRRIGFRYRMTWGWDRRLTSAAGLGFWVLGYVIIGQVGYVITSRVAIAADPGSLATYSNAWLLLQVPYGVLGVSLLTALMPRMSRAAAEGQTDKVVADLGLGSRLSAVALIPIAAVLTVFGTEVGITLFSLGAGSGNGAARLGATLAASAFGVLPYAITLLQLRVFYAMTDSRTPTLVQLVMVAFKIPLLLLCPVLLAPENVVLGLAAANGLSFVAGAVLGQILLRHRLGRLRTRAVLDTTLRALLASAAGLVAAGAVVWALDHSVFQDWSAAGRAWSTLMIVLVVGSPVMLAAMRLVRLAELDPLWRRLAR